MIFSFVEIISRVNLNGFLNFEYNFDALFLEEVESVKVHFRNPLHFCIFAAFLKQAICFKEVNNTEISTINFIISI